MRILFFVVIALFAACGQNSSSDKKGSGTQDTASTNIDTVTNKTTGSPPAYILPDEAAVNASLKGRYDGQWHVLNDKEASWMKDAFDYFIVPRRKTEPNYPYIAIGDYNADGKKDTAAMVTDSLKRQHQVAVLMSDGKAILWEEDIMEDAALSTVSKSDIDGMDGEKTKKIKMKGDGINVEYFEKAAFVLYWDKNTFKRIQTAD